MRMQHHIHYGRNGSEQHHYTFILTKHELMEYQKNCIYTDWGLPSLIRRALLQLIAIHDYLWMVSPTKEVFNETTLLPPSQ